MIGFLTPGNPNGYWDYEVQTGANVRTLSYDDTGHVIADSGNPAWDFVKADLRFTILQQQWITALIRIPATALPGYYDCQLSYPVRNNNNAIVHARSIIRVDTVTRENLPMKRRTRTS